MTLQTVRGRLLGSAQWTPLLLSGLKGWWSARRSPSTRAAGMAAQFTAASLEYLSHAGNATLRGGTTWWRAGWIYLDTAAAMTIEDCLGTNVGYKLNINATPALVLEAGNGTGTSVATHGTTLSATTWYFFFIYYDGTNIGVSLNNGADTTTALSSYSAGATAWNVGALVTPGTYFNGRMQCLIGDNGSLSAAQRTSLYNGGTPLSHDQLPFVLSNNGWIFELNEPSGAREDLGPNALSLTDNATVTTAVGTCLNAISQLDDLSGLGNHMTQTTQANRPVFRRSGVSGFPALRFDGTDDYLSHAGLSSVQNGTDLPYSMAAVIRLDLTTVAHMIGTWGSTVAGNPLIELGASATPDWGCTRRDDANVTQTPNGGTPTTLALIVIYIFSGTAGTLRHDGRVVFTDIASDVGVCTPDRFTIGARLLGGSYSVFLKGHVGELLLFDRVISTVEARRLERYLSHEYGVSLAG